MGHTACGAIKGAIDNVQLGNLTGLPETIKPAVAATFVDAVARTNVQRTIDAIRRTSPVDLEKKGRIKIVGSMYDLRNGAVTFRR